jgi:uncharacterized protein YfaS (alpha-2-macroglobulin family)
MALMLSLLVQACSPAPAQPPGQQVSTQDDPAMSASWKDADRLIEEQKPQEALGVVETIRDGARAKGNSSELTRALVREVQLRVALSGFETAVESLRSQAWPPAGKQRAAVELLHARALVAYLQGYSWEIQKRERIEGEPGKDLKLWSADQLREAAQRSFRAAWAERASFAADPRGTWFDLVEPNDYPAAVRGTLRDSLSYLYADFLADTSLWSPKETNAAYRLPLADLLSGSAEWRTGVEAVGARAHPLAALAATLQDLEQWHRSAGRKAAALEARRVLAQHLWERFENAADRARMRDDFSQRLGALRGDPWWSMGVSTLSGFWRASDDAQAWVRARDLAREAAEAYPASPGGRHCRRIVGELEAPEYEIEIERSSGPASGQVRVAARNVERLYLRAYPIDFAGRLASGKAPWPDFEEFRRLWRSSPKAEWEVRPEATPDLRSRTTVAQLPRLEPGAYAIAVSLRQDFATRRNALRMATAVVGDLVLLARGGQDKPGVLAVSGASGAPLGGVDVELYRHNWQSSRFERIAVSRTDGDGWAALSADERGQNVALARRRAGDRGDPEGAERSERSEMALLDGVASWRNAEPSRQPRTLFFSDRTLYRPGQTIYWKALVFDGDARRGSLAPARAASLTVSLVDGNHQVVADKTVATNEFGTASGEFAVPAGRMLGAWRLQSTLQGSAVVRVEEYKRPSFEVKLKDPAAAPRLNQNARFQGEARYYFGLPVPRGTAAWRVVREAVYPPYWEWRWTGRWAPAVSASETIAAGTSPLAEDGTFALEFLPAADERLAEEKDVSYRYRVSADVTDEGGETRGSERAFRLGFVTIDPTIELDGALIEEKQPSAATILRLDLDGKPRAGTGEWQLFQLLQPVALEAGQAADRSAPARGRAPGRYRKAPPATDIAVALREWSNGPRIAGGGLRQAGEEAARVDLPALAAGAYRLTYATRDDAGAAVEKSLEFVVAAAAGTPLAFPLTAAWVRDELEVGGRARLFVHSGFADPQILLEIFRDSRLESRQWLATKGGTTWFEVPVRDGDRGGFSARVTTVRGHELFAVERHLWVPWTDRTLQLSFATFRDGLKPGQRETWTVEVKDASGKPVEAKAAEILAYMYDRSLDAFAPHQPPRPLDAFASRTGTGWTADTLGWQPAWWLAGEPDEGTEVPNLQDDRFKELQSWFGQAETMVMRVGGGVAGGMVASPQAIPPAPARAKVAEAITVTGEQDSAEEPVADVRSEFQETAFWQPHLLTGRDGRASIEFEVPDSLTSWSVWVHALTRDFRSASLRRETRTFKDLMVRPYLPRYFREGDRLELAVVVNNASSRDLRGSVRLAIAEGGGAGADWLEAFGVSAVASRQPFFAAAGASANVLFPLRVPRRLGLAAVRVEAVADGVSDGELRPIALLPSRLHLAQSRFAVLKDRERRELTFADLARGDDPTLETEKLVATVDGQLFYGVLDSLPYLVDYPYECSEQTLNRFLSTGILTSLFDRYPPVAKMAEQLARRETQFEKFDAPDANRRMALEETPWLEEARGQADDLPDPALIKVLDPRIARAHRESSLARLRQLQLPSGAFPWWPGGQPSPYMTLYVMWGFAKAGEFEVEVPRDMVERGWNYLAQHFRADLERSLRKKDCGCLEFATLLNYVASAYPDPSWMGEGLKPKEREEILGWSFENWKRFAPGLKGLLALTLHRMGRPKDAILVFDSVMDAAKTTAEDGTFWAPEDRGWLWFADTIESHAWVLRVLAELRPADARIAGLVQWIFVNKKLNHWKSTRTTSEVLYSLAYYLARSKQLAVREEIAVELARQRTVFTFEPDRYTGKKNQLVVAGEKVGARDATVVVEKSTPGLALASATWHFATDRLPAESRGDLFHVERRFFRRLGRGEEIVLEPLAEGSALAVGDEIEIQLSIRSRAWAEYVHLRDPRAAGFEPGVKLSGSRHDLGLFFYEETRDAATNFFFEVLPAGEYTLKYRVRAATAGEFRVAPATLQSMYAPEFNAYSSGREIRIARR